MRYRLLIATLSLFSFVAVFSQVTETEPATIVDEINNNGGTITIVQPQIMNQRLKHSGQTVNVPNYNEKAVHNSNVGYRVQVFSDNNVRTAKNRAQSIRGRVTSRFPGVRAYVSFQSPYWRVRVGDFRTRAEAESARADIAAVFPDLSRDIRVVKDKIVINQSN